MDANNNVVGQVIGNDASSLFPLVILNISTPLVIVGVTPNSFQGNKNLYFTGANCSGQVYFGADEVTGRDHMYPIIGAAANVIYRPQANTAPVVFTYNSFMAGFQSTCSGSFGPDSTGIVATPIIDLSTQFTPPYRLVYP